MNLARSSTRWVGQPMFHPQNERGRSPRGRQRHYRAVELAGAGEQVYVNDLVEVIDGLEGLSGVAEEHPRLAQVLSMWEDMFTGARKFRARWLTHLSDLPEDSVSRLNTARRAWATGNPKINGGVRNIGGKVLYTDDTSNDELFLTSRMEDIEVSSIVQPVALPAVGRTTTKKNGVLKRKAGPWLTHAFDDLTGEFDPLDKSDGIFRRARARAKQTGVMTIPPRAGVEKNIVKKNSPRAVRGREHAHAQRSCRRKNQETGIETKFQSTPNRRQLPSSELELSADGSDESGCEKRCDPTQNVARKCDASDGHCTSTYGVDMETYEHSVSQKEESPTQSKPMKQRKRQRRSTCDSEADSGPKFEVSSSAPGTPLYDLAQTPIANPQGSNVCRPRRLAMPSVRREPMFTPKTGEGNISAVSKSYEATCTSHPIRTGIASEALAKHWSDRLRSSSTSIDSGRPRASISGKRKASVLSGSAAKDVAVTPKCAEFLRLSPVGEAYQAEIPELVSSAKRKPQVEKNGARLVWRSTRDWDPQSCNLLEEYLQAARDVIKAKQINPGVPVHVRLVGGNTKRDCKENDEVKSRDIAHSYAGWAIVSGRDQRGLVQMACSDTAHTQVPRSAIQTVQCNQEALTALVKTKCTLDNFQPALEVLANNQASPQSVQLWTLSQVRMLEKALDKEFETKKRLLEWSTPDADVHREDLIDLTKVTSKVSGKTHSQVLSFYYKYLVASRPLTDAVYRPKARCGTTVQARKREADKAGSYAATASSASALTKHAVQQPHTSTLQQHSEPKLPHERTSYKNNDGIKLTTRSKAPTTELVKVKELASAESNRGSKEKKSLARDSVGSKLNGGTNARSAPINPSASLPCGHSQITATAPVAAYPGVPSDDFIAETPDDIVSACDGSIRELQGLPPVEGMNGKPKSAFNDASNTDAGGDGGSSLKAGNSAEAGVQRYDEKWGGKGGGSGGGGHEVPREGRRRVWREEKFPRVVPSNVEVVEVEDSSEEGENGNSISINITSTADAMQNPPRPPTVPSASAVCRPNKKKSGATADARVEKQPDRKSITQPAPSCEPFRLRRTPPTPKPLRINGGEGVAYNDSKHHPAITGPSSGATLECRKDLTYRRNENHNGFVRLDIKQPSLPNVREANESDVDRNRDAIKDGMRGGVGIQRGNGGCGGGGDEEETEASEPEPTAAAEARESFEVFEAFGFMAPCWRLLERARGFMDPDQRDYMKGLILAHVKKPMTRDQLLERAESCLEGQDKILNAFAKMFDRIEQSSLVPLYPSKRKASRASISSMGINPTSAVAPHGTRQPFPTAQHLVHSQSPGSSPPHRSSCAPFRLGVNSSSNCGESSRYSSSAFVGGSTSDRQAMARKARDRDRQATSIPTDAQPPPHSRPYVAPYAYPQHAPPHSTLHSHLNAHPNHAYDSSGGWQTNRIAFEATPHQAALHDSIDAQFHLRRAFSGPGSAAPSLAPYPENWGGNRQQGYEYGGGVVPGVFYPSQHPPPQL